MRFCASKKIKYLLLILEYLYKMSLLILLTPLMNIITRTVLGTFFSSVFSNYVLSRWNWTKNLNKNQRSKTKLTPKFGTLDILYRFIVRPSVQSISCHGYWNFIAKKIVDLTTIHKKMLDIVTKKLEYYRNRKI